MAPNEKVFFMKNWGRDQTHEVKGYVLVVKVQFFLVFFEQMKERGYCTSIFHFADRPELPCEVDF